MHLAESRPISTAMRQFSFSDLAWVPSRLSVRRATVFVISAGLTTYIAMRGGGYDIVVRQELALVVWAFIALGLTLGVFPRSRPMRAILIPLGFVTALLVWMCLSLHWTESAERTFAEIARFLMYAGIATLAIVSLNRHTFRAAASGLSVAALAVAAIAVASRLDPGSFPAAEGLARQFHTNRLSYPLDYWNAVGTWGAMGMAIGLAWSAHAKNTALRALGLGAVPVAALAVYLSYSRGGVLAAGVGVVAVIALARNRWTTFAHVLVAGGATAIVVLVARSHPEIANGTGGVGGSSVAFALVCAAAICAAGALGTAAIKADRARVPKSTAAWAVPTFVIGLCVATLALGHGPISRAWNQFQDQDQSSPVGLTLRND